jgi:hypothetical protein
MQKPTATILAAAAVGVTALAGVAFLAGRGESQAATAKLTVGIYAPSVEFGAASARLAYVQGLAKAIETNTGIKTEAQSYASLGALKNDNVDFAVIDGQCYAVNQGWRLLANANIGGATARPWALFSAVGPDMQGLKGKKLSFIQTGCNDNAFIDNAMLESEVDASFFSARVGKPDLTAAVAEVASLKGAQAVFAPVGTQKGLTKVFDTGMVPNPAFVQLNAKLPTTIADKVGAAVVGYGGAGAISSWAGASKVPFQALAGRFGKVVKSGVFANPDPVRFDAKDVLIDPTTLKDTSLTEVRQHFVRPGDRME